MAAHRIPVTGGTASVHVNILPPGWVAAFAGEDPSTPTLMAVHSVIDRVVATPEGADVKTYHRCSRPDGGAGLVVAEHAADFLGITFIPPHVLFGGAPEPGDRPTRLALPR